MRTAFAGLALVVLLPVSASAQQWSAEQLEVWQVELDVWKMDLSGDRTWIDKYVHDDLLAWSNDELVPLSKSSIDKWYRFENAGSKYPVHELYPIGIVVNGNVAVVHYFYSLGEEDAKGERHTRRGSYTDVLVKENGTWRYLTWRGGLIEEED